MKLHLRFISGINSDYIQTVLTTDFGTHPIKKTLYPGIDFCFTRERATAEVPFIGDILYDLVESNNIPAENIEYSGYLKFPDREMTEKEVDSAFNFLSFI